MLSYRESLGIGGCLSIVGSSLLATGLLGFLASLWFGHGTEPEGRSAASLWRFLALRGWMIQTITICSLIIRLLVSIQATVCTSMIAALILEKHSVRKSDVAYISVFRAINDGPRKLVSLLFCSKSPATLRYIEFWLLLWLALLTLGLQFSSTILLSDVRDFTIVGNTNSTQIQSLFFVPDDKGEDWSFNFIDLLRAEPIFSTFGERQINSSLVPDSQGFSDTGLIQQGLFPFMDSDTRISTRDYSGPGMVLNSRVVCMPPVVDAKYYLAPHYGIEATGLGYLEGTLKYGESIHASYGSVPSPCVAESCEGINFVCGVPLAIETTNNWQSSVCVVSVGGTAPDLDSTTKWDASSMPWSYDVPLYLVLTSNTHMEDWPSDNASHALDAGERFGEWQSFELAGGHVNATLCLPALNTERYQVHMTTGDAVEEPTLAWNLTSTITDTENIERYLGTSMSDLSNQERGIFELELHAQPEAGPALDLFPMNNMTIGMLTTRVPETLVYWNMGFAIEANQSIPLCLECYLEPVPIHVVFVSLMANIIAKTGRAASAIHSFIYMLTTGAYAESLKLNYPAESVELAITSVVRTPGPCGERSCPGFASVTALYGAYTVCVAVITCLYVRQARHSRCSHIWHTVSQLASEELHDMFLDGNDARDDFVNKEMRRRGHDNLVRLQVLDGEGRVGVVKHIPTIVSARDSET